MRIKPKQKVYIACGPRVNSHNVQWRASVGVLLPVQAHVFFTAAFKGFSKFNNFIIYEKLSLLERSNSNWSFVLILVWLEDKEENFKYRKSHHRITICLIDTNQIINPFPTVAATLLYFIDCNSLILSTGFIFTAFQIHSIISIASIQIMSSFWFESLKV